MQRRARYVFGVLRSFAFPLGKLVMALSVAAAACGGSEPEDTTPPEGSEVSCADDPRVDTYTANMAKAGENGVLTFEFSDADPAPPAKGMNTLRVRVSDAAGAPVIGRLQVELDMPDHGHGTSVPPAAMFDAATSAYTVGSLYMFMAGVWRIEFAASSAEGADPVDRTALHFCIEG